MILHEKLDTFRNAIRAASDHLNRREVFVEKDYWVTFFLKRLSESEYKNEVVFKGGTSLSKVYNLIDRFSEDVDLAIIKLDDQTETYLRNLIRKVEKHLSEGFNEVNIKEVTSKQTKFRKTAYEYSKHVDSASESGIQDKLILEINSLANPVPYKAETANSLIAQFFIETDQNERIVEFGLEKFELNVLIPESTLIEKILSVIRLSFYDDGVGRLKKKVRHFYDIYFLSKSKECKEFIESNDFPERFKEMLEEDKGKFKDPENWLNSDFKESPIFKSFDEIWAEVKLTYNADFKDLVHGEFPDEKEIAEQFKGILKILS